MKKKLKLSELNVQSFVTETKEVNAKTLKGGELNAEIPPPTKPCNTVYRCHIPTLPAAECTSNYTVERCPTLPIEDCIWLAIG